MPRTTAIPQQRPMQVLLVEDNAADARLTEEGLEQADIDCEVHRAGNVTEAWEFLTGGDGEEEGSVPDLVLLDLNLPGSNGHELLRRMRQEAALDRVPVVILSTSEQLDDVRRSYELEANGYITKPIDYQDFLERVRSVCTYWGNLEIPPGDGAPAGEP